MKTIMIRTTWTATHEVEVPDDYEFGSGLDDEWIHQVDAHTAELIDWDLA